VNPSRWQVWLAAARPRTLPAAVAPVLVGSALAWRAEKFDGRAALICLAFALLIQIGTNFANDYFDFRHGADTAERIGPRRAVAAGWVTPVAMQHAMWGVFGAAFLVGLALLAWGGWWLLGIGVACIACGIAYTGGPYPLGYHGLGDIFVFLFFGLVAVGTTFYVQVGTVTAAAVIAAVAIGALTTNILVVNNYRDVETDRVAGKRTLVVRFGRHFARTQFAVAHAIALTAPIFLAAHGVASLMTLSVPLAVLAIIATRQYVMLKRAETPQHYLRLLSQAGLYLAAYAAVLSVWIAVGK
jgi:1,4-dihydroxy-2-naphthoate polyprenyltransferase